MKSPQVVSVPTSKATSIEFRLSRWLLLLVALSWPYSASAHESGTPRLVHVAAGVSRLSAWSAPEPPRGGDLHISVAVDEPQPNNTSSASAQTNLDVQIAAISLDHRTQMNQRATIQTTFFQSYYESYFTIPATGRWQVVIVVTGVAGSGTASFVLDVLPHQRVNWELVFGCAIVLVTIIWAGRVMCKRS